MRSSVALASRHAVAFWPLPTTTTVSSLVSYKVFRPKFSVSRLKSLENGVLFKNRTGPAAFSAPHRPSHHLAHLSTEPSAPRHQHRATGDHETAGASQPQAARGVTTRETARSHAKRRRCALGIIRWVERQFMIPSPLIHLVQEQKMGRHGCADTVPLARSWLGLFELAVWRRYIYAKEAHDLDFASKCDRELGLRAPRLMFACCRQIERLESTERRRTAVGRVAGFRCAAMEGMA